MTRCNQLQNQERPVTGAVQSIARPEVTRDNPHLSPLSPASAVPPLVRGYLDAARAPSTHRAYAIDARAFLAHGGRIPCTDAELAQFLTASAGHWSCATLARRLAGIGHAHRQLGFVDPTRSPLVRGVLRGLRRVHGRPPRQAVAVTLPQLDVALADGDGLPRLRDRALLLLGFAAGLRRGELVGLDVEDLRWTGEGLQATVRAGKGDPMRTGRQVAVARRHGGLCPVAALARWLDEAGITTGPIFRAVTRAGRVRNERLSAGSVTVVLRRYALGLGHVPSTLSAHSLRAGFATAAARAGVTPDLIRRQTGHRSLATLQGYIRAADPFAATREVWAAADTGRSDTGAGPMDEDVVLAMGAAILERRLRRMESIADPSTAEQYLRQRLAGLRDEVFLVLFLDTRHAVLAAEALFSGTVDHAEVHPRVIVRRALELNAAALICAHNHPSGNAEPSAADRAVTARIKQALALVDVRLLDHFVVTAGGCISLAARGWV